jgi:hypothetical protein
VPGVFFRHLLGFHHAQTFIADKATSLPAAKK